MIVRAQADLFAAAAARLVNGEAIEVTILSPAEYGLQASGLLDLVGLSARCGAWPFARALRISSLFRQGSLGGSVRSIRQRYSAVRKWGAIVLLFGYRAAARKGDQKKNGADQLHVDLLDRRERALPWPQFPKVSAPSASEIHVQRLVHIYSQDAETKSVCNLTKQHSWCPVRDPLDGEQPALIDLIYGSPADAFRHFLLVHRNRSVKRLLRSDERVA